MRERNGHDISSTLFDITSWVCFCQGQCYYNFPEPRFERHFIPTHQIRIFRVQSSNLGRSSLKCSKPHQPCMWISVTPTQKRFSKLFLEKQNSVSSNIHTFTPVREAKGSPVGIITRSSWGLTLNPKVNLANKWKWFFFFCCGPAGSLDPM